MGSLFTHLIKALAGRRLAWRRARNLRRGGTSRGSGGARGAAARSDGARFRPAALAAVLGLALALAGAAVIVGHARKLGAATLSTEGGAGASRAAHVFQSVLPGAVIEAPARQGVRYVQVKGGAVVTLAGMRAMVPVRVDLCGQMREPGGARLAPLRLGYRYGDVQRMRELQGAAPRNVVLAGGASGASDDMPEVTISGNARADFARPEGEALRLAWRGAAGQPVRWLGDDSQGRTTEGREAAVSFRREGWLAWGEDAALRVERRASAACSQAGELVMQLHRRDPRARAAVLVAAFAERGAAAQAWLPAGVYAVPAAAPAALEDQALFAALQARGLVRLAADGAVVAAPRDLPLWSASDSAQRASGLAEWADVRMDADAARLLKRLYQQADGAYVRQQIDVHNSERRLLAWRVASGPAWQASASGAPLPATGRMPGAASRLFAELPQGWQPWSRVAAWPAGGGAVRLALAYSPGETGFAGAAARADGAALRLLVAGRVGAVAGADILSRRAACTGRGCSAPDDVTELSLAPHRGASAITVDVLPLDLAAMGGPADQQYRHLRVAGGRVSWQALAPQALAPPRRGGPASSVLLRDRNGTLLWADGAPAPAALDAGLAPMLGIGPGHASGIAGMLARLPATSGGAVTGTLSLDLPLQALSQRVLECVGMHRGRWDGKACAGARPAPQGRQAGLVLLDAENGDILAAAGAGNAPVGAANWEEARDFDRANPARSPLRLPAFQHDGGAHRSPGSTFKVVSALGLELAAKSDPRLDALLGGMPLAGINDVARQRGYAFQTGAATYPATGNGAHVTNYREQAIDRRAQEGRLGLSQALTYSLNTWFAWTAEMSDRSLFGRPDGGAPGMQALEADGMDGVRPVAAAARRLGFGQELHLDGGLLPVDYAWSAYDALQATPARMDAIQTRHEVRQMAIGLRMQATPLQMAMVSAAIGGGATVPPRLLLELDGKPAAPPAPARLDARLDRIRAGMKGVVDGGTAAGAFGGARLAALRPGLYGKTGTAPVTDGAATVWFTGWLEPGSLPGQTRRLAMAVFVSHSEGSGGEHAAPVIAALLGALSAQNVEQRGK
ncbi:penicillin-binding transpeptidase domain-containing protein [Pseudoduganella namucuonensis]|uniref:beta-lactamase n=1 Tax=Pseudoduganella namucuonensis TaxID=1035707 RepID=A0A1I7GS38_9BURK|nr:penicillin-binding transpeptidase domain-containing protein [Pseudoduganella namucuonensis]SFU51240.1 Penicillin binding protein transpeptidase domain-containing protein [Pseudoduganella namucuonensis]